ncbi:MAG: FtsX-like permease family protein [Alphaproteobacteria bacterium]|nr:FtsX-like permease family protein [Alphaproteobacteria bacterium]
MTFLGLARKNLFRKKLRLILTTVAIIVAFLIFGVLGAFQATLTSGVDLAGADRLIVTHKINFTLNLPRAHVAKIAAIPGVKRLTYHDWFGGYYQEPRNFIVAIAVEPESFLEVYPEYQLTPQERAQFLSTLDGIIVGKTLADQYGWKVGDRLPLHSNIYSQESGGSTWDFVVSGIFTGADARTDTSAVYFNHKYFDESRSFGRDTIGWLTVQTEDAKLNPEVIKAIDETFANSAYETATTTEAQFQAAFVNQLGDIGFMVTAVSGAAFFTILLIVGNTMMLAVRERTTEIAVLKTIGFTSGRIFVLILGESLLLALLGGIIGLLLASLATMVVSQAGGFLATMTMTPSVALTGVGIMAALGLVTGLFPAMRAMNLNVVQGLERR